MSSHRLLTCGFNTKKYPNPKGIQHQKYQTENCCKDLIKGVNQLNNSDLEEFINQVWSIKTKRIASSLSKAESILLKKINRGLSTEKIEKKYHLFDKKNQGVISDQELKELQEIVSESESIAVERLNYLIELAEIRAISVSDLMEELDIKSNYYG